MRFLKGGPDIPECLLEAHEDGRVVFFCGTGISSTARLPNFAELVNLLYKRLTVTPNAVQKAAIKGKQFDTAVGLLEAETIGGREQVRRELTRILTPDLSAAQATSTHKALLTLGKARDGNTRLVTTNFDRLFEEVIAKESLSVYRDSAPKLPVPKIQWNSLVYLHGLITSEPTPDELDRLVVSSGDFGRAYLTERWASRFVTELFRNFTVCFVGYSISDPVLRYILDAFAADRLLGGSASKVFAFAGYSTAKEGNHETEWLAKNVTPILYPQARRHVRLQKTLSIWAATYRDGVQGKERVVVESARAHPQTSTRQDDFVPRVLWALSDPSGLPAKRFSELDPTPPLEWLEPLSEMRYSKSDLSRFGVPPKKSPDAQLIYSLINRPAPYDLAPWMSLVSTGGRGSHWDNVMSQLARWLLWHLDDPQLVLWLIRQNGELTDKLALLLRQRLEYIAGLESAGNSTQLERMRSISPGAIPRPAMRTLWELLLSGRASYGGQSVNFYDWITRFKKYGLTLAIRFEFRNMLTPKVALSEPIPWPFDGRKSKTLDRIKDLVDWNIVLSSKYVHYGLRELANNDSWKSSLPRLLGDFSQLLRDALDLMHELGGAEEKSDLSYIYQPSISKHPLNRDFREWTALIDLTREAWISTSAKDTESARLFAVTWWNSPYPLLRRLAFFAAAQGDVIPQQLALDWLLSDENWWLWSVETQREAMRLIVALAPRLNWGQKTRLEEAIVAGPPRTMFKEELEPERWGRIVDRETWLRLAKIIQGGASLGAVADTRFAEITSQNHQWTLADNEREEFPYWMEDATWVSDRDPWRTFVSIPRRRKGLLDYLRQHPVVEEGKQDDWRERCKDSFQASAYALCQLAAKKIWPSERWREALQIWSDEKLRQRSWRYMAPLLATAPTEFLESLLHALSWWLQSLAKTFEDHEETFFSLIRRVIEFAEEGSASMDEPVTQAINHPVGQLTEALINWWDRRSLEDAQGLPSQLRPIFTELCDSGVEKYRYGRVLLAAHAIALFRVDQEWAERHLIPLFDWGRSEMEAAATWAGFLWSPRLYRPFIEAIKRPFLDTAKHYDALGNHGGQFAALMTFAALDKGDTFKASELAAATSALPEAGLHETTRALNQALGAAGDQRAEYWKNRIVPYLQRIWPRTRDKASPIIAEGLGLLCVSAGDAFPEAINILRYWLKPPVHANNVLHQLYKAGLTSRYPEAALDLVDFMVADEPQLLPDLAVCVEGISAAKPSLEDDRRFKRLVTLLRKSRDNGIPNI